MDNINDIISSLSSDDIESLRSMAQSIFGSDSPDPSFAPKEEEQNTDLPFSPDMLIKISAVMNKLNGSSDSGRYKLIQALKPNLSKERQKKADEAMQIMKVLEVLPMITQLYKGGDNSADK